MEPDQSRGGGGSRPVMSIRTYATMYCSLRMRISWRQSRKPSTNLRFSFSRPRFYGRNGNSTGSSSSSSKRDEPPGPYMSYVYSSIGRTSHSRQVTNEETAWTATALVAAALRGLAEAEEPDLIREKAVVERSGQAEPGNSRPQADIRSTAGQCW